MAKKNTSNRAKRQEKIKEIIKNTHVKYPMWGVDLIWTEVASTTNDFKDLLKSSNIRQRMSRRGNPYDNACAENFFSCLKCECTHFYPFRNRDA